MSLKAGYGGVSKKYVDAYGNPITNQITQTKGGNKNATKSRKKRIK